MISGAVLCLVYIMFSMPEGPMQMFEIANEHDKFSLGSYSLSLKESTFWVVLVYGIFINLNNYGIDQNYVQRYMASKSDREAKRSAFFGGMLYIPVSMLFLFIGTHVDQRQPILAIRPFVTDVYTDIECIGYFPPEIIANLLVCPSVQHQSHHV